MRTLTALRARCRSPGPSKPSMHGAGGVSIWGLPGSSDGVVCVPSGDMRQPGDWCPLGLGQLLGPGQLVQTQVGEVTGRQDGGLDGTAGAGLLCSHLPPS